MRVLFKLGARGEEDDVDQALLLHGGASGLDQTSPAWTMMPPRWPDPVSSLFRVSLVSNVIKPM
jgi:hypothetical protein